MSLSPFEHPLLSAWVDAGEIPQLFSLESEMKAWLDFERELARAQANCGLFDYAHVEAIAVAAEEFQPDMDLLRDKVRQDGLAIPGFIAQFRDFVGGEAAGFVHYGATSQDVIDTALMIRLKKANAMMIENLDTLAEALDFLVRTHGEKEVMGVTRMQNALPIKAATRFEAWREPVIRGTNRLEKLGERTFCVQLGGPVGDNSKLAEQAEEIIASLAEYLELAVPENCWHTTRDNLVAYASTLSLITGTLGKIGADMSLMAQNDVGTIRLSGGGGSSAMVHKKNPVLAESLVTLAGFNATQLAAMHMAQVHEMERSGSAWSLEWLVLPQMVAATAAAIGNCEKLLSQIEDVVGM